MDNKNIFASFLNVYKPDNNLIKPTTELLEKYNEKLPKEMLEFWKRYGFGNYGKGLLKIVNPEEYKKYLFYYIKNVTNQIPLLIDAFGNIFYYRKLQDDVDDISVINIHYNFIEVCAYSFQDFFTKIVISKYFRETLYLNLFDQAIIMRGELKSDEIFFFAPFLMLGGSETIDNVQKGNVFVHYEIINELSNKVSSNNEKNDIKTLTTNDQNQSSIISTFDALMSNKDFDFNFKLVLVDNLLYNEENTYPSFEREYLSILNSETYKKEKMQIVNDNIYDTYCPSLYKYLQDLKILEEDLDKINMLKIDSIAKIYSDLQPNWGADSDIFNLKTLDGIERLKNLKRMDVVYAMIDHEIPNNVENVLETLKCEVWINNGFDIYNIKNSEDNKQLECINNFPPLLLDYVAQINNDETLRTAMWNYAKFRVLEPTDKLIFNNNESNYNQKLFGKSPDGNDYVLLDNEKVGYVDHEGSCAIIANNIKDFFAFLLIAPKCLYSLLLSLTSFDDFIKIINEAREYPQKLSNDYIQYEQIINEFLIKNNIETDIETIYKNVLEAVITEPPLIMTIIEKKKSYFSAMPDIIDEYKIDNEWVDDNNIQKLKEIYNNLVSNDFKQINDNPVDIMSKKFKYKLGTIFNNELKLQLINDDFKDVANKDLDFGLKQEFYSNDKLYLSFNADVFNENSNMVLNNIMILEGNQENSLLNIKLGDYNSSAKSILKDNNYKEAKSEIENIKKYVNIEKNIALELWLEDFKIYKIVLEKVSNEDVANIELKPQFKTDPWKKKI